MDLNAFPKAEKKVIPAMFGGLRVSYSVDAITPRIRREMAAAQQADETGIELVMALLEGLAVEWDLTKDGRPVLPLREVPPAIAAQCQIDGTPLPWTMLDVEMKHLVAILGEINEDAAPKEGKNTPA